MMRQEIELTVEQLLFDTRPSHAFSASVIAALPSATTLGSTIAKTGTAVGAKFVGAKVAGLLTAGGMIGILGGALGSLIGIGGAWLGTRNAASQATSDEERILLWKFFRWTLIAAIVFSLAVLGLVLLADGTARVIGLGVAVLVYVIGLPTAIIRFNAAQKKLHALHGKPACWGNADGPAVVSIRAVRLNSIGMLLGVWCWLLVLAAIKSAFAIMALAVLAIIAHGAWIWVSALSARTAGSQLRFNARICFWASVLQVVIAIVGGITHRDFAAGHQGFPIWALCSMVLALGTTIGRLLTIKGNRLDKQLTEKQGIEE